MKTMSLPLPVRLTIKNVSGFIMNADKSGGKEEVELAAKIVARDSVVIHRQICGLYDTNIAGTKPGCTIGLRPDELKYFWIEVL